MHSISRLFFGVLIMGLPLTTFAEIRLSGELTQHTTWDSAHSPYIIEHDFTVGKGVILTVLPGTEIRMGDANSLSFFVKGVVYARGTKENPIVFTSLTGERQGWTLTLASSTATSLLRHVVISNSVGGIYLDRSKISLENVVFDNNEYGITANGAVIEGDAIVVQPSTYSSISLGNATRALLKNITITQSNAGAAIDIGTRSLLDIDGLTVYASSTHPVMVSRNSSLLLRNSLLVGDQNSDAVVAYSSRIQIASSSITHFGTALRSQGSSFDIATTTIAANNKGIVANPPQGSFISQSEYGIGGEGNLFDSVDTTHTVIHGSVIENNFENDIVNLNDASIDATFNWWGIDKEPIKNIGSVVTNPWLTSDPRVSISRCCSSILFIPGFQGSRLYIDEEGIFATSTNTLWEPNRNDDVRKLFMTSSTTSSVYTKDILDTVGISSSIYGDFKKFLNTLVAQKEITEWTDFPYDWRYDIRTVVEQGATTILGKRYLVPILNQLAAASLTGKVTIVAHSNGGLVAKYFLASIKDSDLSKLIDKIILVGTPELGTPKAVASLLHGYDQAIGKGLLLNKSVAREFGYNMAGAYGLLPSREYFKNITKPLVAIATTVPETTLLQRNPSVVDNYLSFYNFLSGEDTRKQPDVKDTISPQVLHESLISLSDTIHLAIDAIDFPKEIPIFRIIGTGLDTVEGLVYKGSEVPVSECRGLSSVFSFLCKDVQKLVTTVVTTPHGDGTVVTHSAQGSTFSLLSSAGNYFVDLLKIREHDDTDIDHATLLNSRVIQDLIRQVVMATSSNSGHVVYDTQYVSTTEPSFDERKTLTISVHSPADIHVYDMQGRHVGVVQNDDADSSDIIRSEIQIPGSQYFNPGEEGQVVTLPYGKEYSVEIRGTGVGTFSVTAEYSIGTTTQTKSDFVDMPITPLTVARFTPEYRADATTTANILSVDINGDGIIDANVSSSLSLDIQAHLNLLKASILQLDIPQKIQEQLQRRLSRVATFWEKDHAKQAKDVIENSIKGVTLSRGGFRKVSEEDREYIVELLDAMLAVLEKSFGK